MCVSLFRLRSEFARAGNQQGVHERVGRHSLCIVDKTTHARAAITVGLSAGHSLVIHSNKCEADVSAICTPRTRYIQKAYACRGWEEQTERALSRKGGDGQIDW